MKRFLSVTLALLLLSFAPLEAKPAISTLNFAVFGDWGSLLKNQRDVAQGLSDYAKTSKKAKNPLDFVVLTGDNFYEGGVTSTTDPQWQSKFEQMYDKKTLDVPFYAVLGNHDWKLNPAAQIAYSATPKTRWKMDGFYYQKSFGGNAEKPLADFFFIDSDLWLERFGSPNLGAKQTKWLEESLRNSRAIWRFVVLHHPPFSDGAHALDAELVTVREIVVPLCEKYGVATVFSGHDHDLQRIQFGDKTSTFVVSGAGGASLRERKTQNYGPFYRAKTAGFLTVQLSETQFNGRFLSAKNEVLDEWTQKPVAMPALVAAP